MASDPAANTVTSASQTPKHSDVWSKTELESALAHLERMQDQIDSLRSAIPDLVRPLQAAGDGQVPRTKADVLLEVRNAALRRAGDLERLKGDWGGEETKRVLERARESEARDGELGRCVEVPTWGWLERDEGMRNGSDGHEA